MPSRYRSRSRSRSPDHYKRTRSSRDYKSDYQSDYKRDYKKEVRSRPSQRRNSRSKSPVDNARERRNNVEGMGAKAYRDRLLDGTKVIEKKQVKEKTEEDLMKEMLGFGDFSTTKGGPVQENQKGPSHGAARKANKRNYRQYMNRKGGFGKPVQGS